MMPEAMYTIVCPGCGWVGKEEELCSKECPQCGYQNGSAPYRLLTVKEMLEFPCDGNTNDVNLYEFLNAIKPFLQDVDPNLFPDTWKKYKQ
jgi:hypothetical protein